MDRSLPEREQEKNVMRKKEMALAYSCRLPNFYICAPCLGHPDD
jgi:hypothetical protein